MSYEDIDTQFHLENVDFKQDFSDQVGDPWLTSQAKSNMQVEYTGLGSHTGGFEGELRDYLQNVVLKGFLNPPNWETFITQFRVLYGQEATDPAAGALVRTPPLDGFRDDIMTMLGLPTDGSDLREWGILAGAVIGDLSNQTRLDFFSLMTAGAFEHFIRVVIGKYQDPGTLSPQQFFREWGNFFLRTTAVFETEDATGAYVDFTTYERIYRGFFPLKGEETEDDFQARFKGDLAFFVNKVIGEDGYFLPSHHVEVWLDELKASVTGIPAPADFTSLDDFIGRENQALILLVVFNLLVDMIGVIQRAAVAQAARVQVMAEWQKSYTDLMGQMPIGTGNRPAELRASQTEGATPASLKAEFNAIGQPKIEHLRAYRDIIGDETKQIQTNVNILNDAASQQASTATAILQNLSGILTLLFR